MEQTWRTASFATEGKALVLDVSSATGIDEATNSLLQQWFGAGAQVVSKAQEGGLPAESDNKRHPVGKLLSYIRTCIERFAVTLTPGRLRDVSWARLN